jgi:hypothetical protein
MKLETTQAPILPAMFWKSVTLNSAMEVTEKTTESGTAHSQNDTHI